MKNRNEIKVKRQDLTPLVLLGLDAVMFVFAIQVAAMTVFQMNFRSFMAHNIYFTVFTGTVLILNFYFFDLYYTLKDFRRFRQAVNLVVAVSVSFVISQTLLDEPPHGPWYYVKWCESSFLFQW